MYRRKLLEGLRVYRGANPEELQLVDRFDSFINENVDCFDRSNLEGHVTGSAWLVSPDGRQALLTHHKKLGRWLQLGGHSDGEFDTLLVSKREAEEESGLKVEPLDETIFDIDIHEIPARGDEPAHLHFDVRFLFRALGLRFVVSSESHDLRWVDLLNIEKFSNEWSVIRMRDKCLKKLGRD